MFLNEGHTRWYLFYLQLDFPLYSLHIKDVVVSVCIILSLNLSGIFPKSDFLHTELGDIYRSYAVSDSSFRYVALHIYFILSSCIIFKFFFCTFASLILCFQCKSVRLYCQFIRTLVFVDSIRAWYLSQHEYFSETSFVSPHKDI